MVERQQWWRLPHKIPTCSALNHLAGCSQISFAQQLRNDTSLLAVVNAYDARAKATGSYVDYAYHVVVS